MQHAMNRNAVDSVAVRRNEIRQSCDTIMVGSGCLADQDPFPEYDHVAAVQRCRGLEPHDRAMMSQYILNRGELAEARGGAGAQHDGDFVEHQCGVFNEDCVRMIDEPRQLDYRHPEAAKRIEISIVLGNCTLDVDRYPIDVSQLTVAQFGAGRPGQGNQHASTLPITRSLCRVVRLVTPHPGDPMELQPIVYVTDMDRAVDWYGTVLDVRPAYQSPEWTALPVGNATLGLHITDVRPAESYLALSLVAERPLEEVVERLESAGITIATEIRDEGFGRSLLVIDPDGTAIQVNEHRR